MANGQLATWAPTVSPYSNLGTSSTLTRNDFNIYTAPGATLMSGTLRISNDTGSAAAVDVAIVEQTDCIQLDVPGNQPSGADFGDYAFPEGEFTTSIAIEGANVTGTFSPGETVTWTNTGLAAAYQSVTSIVERWDSGNSKLWLRNVSHPLALDVAGDTTFTGPSGTISAGPSYAGTGGYAGWSGKIKYYDSNLGVIYLNNYEFANNLDYRYLGTIGNGVGEEEKNSNNCSVCVSQSRLWRPVATTQTRYAAAGNTTPTTEFVDENGVELLVASVAAVKEHQYIAKSRSVSDNETLELTGIVLGPYQSLYVSSAAAVSCSLVGFEEPAS